MKKAILLLSALTISGVMNAQTEERDAVVNVENGYTPVVIEVGKMNFTPSTNRNIDIQPAKAKFSKKGIVYKEFTSEREIDDVLPKKEEELPGYARLGYGLTNDIDAKVAYRLGVGKNGALKAHATFDGFKCNVGGLSDKWNSRFFNNAIGVGYRHSFNSLTLDIDGKFGNSVYNYRDMGMDNSITDKQNSRNYAIAIGGTSNLQGAISYDFSGDFEYFARSYTAGAKNGIGEGRFGIGGGIAYDIYNDLIRKVGIDLHLDAFIYDRTLEREHQGFCTHFSIDANPSLGFTFGNWTVGVGTKMNFITRGGGVFAIAPNISAESNLNKNVTVYAGITGGRESNSLAKLESMSPYWGFTNGGMERLKPTYKIADINIGSRMSFKTLSFDINAGYAYTQKDLLQVAVPQISNDSCYSLIYSNFVQDNTHHLYVGARLGFNFRSWIKLSGEAKYDFWACSNKDLLMMKPEVRASVNAEARIIEHLTLQLGYDYALYTKGKTTGRISDKHDLHARLSYQITKRFGAYIEGNNLINDKYYEFAGYETRGIRGSLGATVNF